MTSNDESLSTKEALNRLHDDIENVHRQYQSKNPDGKFKSWLFDSLHHTSRYTTINWITTGVLSIYVLILFIVFIIEPHRYQYALINSIILLTFLLFNLYITFTDNRYRNQEISKRVSALLATLKLAVKNVKWLPENYPHLCTPFSPCVTMQWTYRDGVLVNLPWALLVRGDIIVIRPGQLSPGLCEAVTSNSEYSILQPKQIYGPPLPNANEIFSVPRAKVPLQNQIFRIKETPYLSNLKIALDKALKRPVTHFNQQRYLLVNKYIEMFTYPTFLLTIFIINCIKYFYLTELVGSSEIINLFLLDPIATTLPLLPIAFPIFWISLNALGMARFKALFNTTSKVPITMESDPFTEIELAESDLDFSHQWAEVWSIFLNIISGKEIMMTRSANILHVFGHLSALCVVDKKGILSWPNPTPEKIFFLRSSGTLSQTSSLESVDSAGDGDSINIKTKQTTSNLAKGTVTEVLDVTHNRNIPFKLDFDDREWQQHLSSLKPLGLAILLNTCNMDTHENYNQFCSHITCEAMHNENLVPVSNRRCLCELAKKIGFLDTAQTIFNLEEQLYTFRHLTDMVKRDKFAKALHLTTKLKFPFPHMVAVIIKELNNGSKQLFSQGTADIILDSCVDFWDGKDLCPLSPSDRKKITDFYSRTSLTAYCTAFAYRPLNAIVDHKLSNVYMELPSDCKHLYFTQRSPTPIHWDGSNYLDPRVKGNACHFHSTDSLLYNDNKEQVVADIDSCFQTQCNQIFIGMVTMQYQAQSDMIHLIERLERACVRFVHFSKENELRSRVFSEKMGLESGWNCHISLLSEKPECWTNNGTTRVWSPSCMPTNVTKHPYDGDKSAISEEHQLLLPSTNLGLSKPMSLSAPSAINLEYSVVKFEEDPTVEPEDSNKKVEIVDPTKTELIEVLIENEETSEKDSIMLQSIDLSSHQEGWPSLSCLTDSTEQSAPVNFDMSNRAKLPRGIENIRPHLEAIDNVPLLVSLFTDCTANVTAEMIKIMQDYGQTVCVLGSAANADNMDVFMQADASIAIEPLYPQVCQKTPVFIPVAPVHGPSPVGLNRSLNSLACSLAFRREDPVSIFHLTLEARHYMLAFWNCLQFWLCCTVTLSSLQLITIILLLPPLLNVGQVLWYVCFIIPALAISLIGVQTDSSVMQRPSQKFQYIFNAEIAIFVIWCYCGKFVPLILFIVLMYSGLLINYCQNIAVSVDRNITCSILYPTMKLEEEIVVSWNDYEHYLITAQQITLFMVVILFLTLSVCFVHRDHSIWIKLPTENKLWSATIIFLFIVQIFYSILALTTLPPSDEENISPFWNLPWYILLLLIILPIITFVIAEFIKLQEIKINLRWQRRARLDFGTKLGMNSPF